MDNTPYLNRELSILQFNRRVFSYALDPDIPLLERLNYALICSANLDEFFEIRVAHLQLQAIRQPNSKTLDGYDPRQVLQAISQMTHQLVSEQYLVLNEQLFPALAEAGIRFVPEEQWTPTQAAWVKQYFRTRVLPLLSPIALDPAHPFPRLVNKSLNFIVSLTGKDAFGRDYGLAVVHAPRSLARLIRLPDEGSGGDHFVYLSHIIAAHVEELFSGMEITGCYQFRVTRNSDSLLNPEEIDDLSKALQKELLSRRYGAATRLEVVQNCPPTILQFLLEQHQLQESDLYLVNGPVNMGRYRALLALIDYPQLRYPAFTATVPPELLKHKNIFSCIRKRDILLGHPWQSFTSVIELIQQAAIDAKVLAIKVTLYRTGANSPMVDALVQAARAGKEVTAVIELMARFDEADNIDLANRLHVAGALVVYGVLGFKTHAKMLLVVRQEDDQLVRYVHLGTGNYHANTAKVYVDYGVFTYDEQITRDVQSVFQQLTGMGKAIKLQRLLHAPFTLLKSLKEKIAQESEWARQGKSARIIAKMNALTEPTIIQALYQASQAGVQIDLIVRGACCLRPGVPGLSDNIRVRSIVGRFLEHARIYYFYNNGDEMLFLASADWMTRNFFRRVEVCFPVQDKQLLERIKQEALLLYLADNKQAWELQTDGNYCKVDATRATPQAAQEVLLERYVPPTPAEPKIE